MQNFWAGAAYAAGGEMHDEDEDGLWIFQRENAECHMVI